METVEIFDVDKEMKWYKYEKLDNQKLKSCINDSSGKKFHKYKLDGTFIKTMNNVREAAEQVGVHRDVLLKCLKGIYRTAGGYKWEYAE